MSSFSCAFSVRGPHASHTISSSVVSELVTGFPYSSAALNTTTFSVPRFTSVYICVCLKGYRIPLEGSITRELTNKLYTPGASASTLIPFTSTFISYIPAVWMLYRQRNLPKPPMSRQVTSGRLLPTSCPADTPVGFWFSSRSVTLYSLQTPAMA